MAPSAESIALPVHPVKSSSTHPFAPLSKDEILNASRLVQAQWPEGTDLHYKAVTLEEPLKAEAVHYLVAEHEGKSVPSIDRRALVAYYIRKTVSHASQT